MAKLSIRDDAAYCAASDKLAALQQREAETRAKLADTLGRRYRKRAQLDDAVAALLNDQAAQPVAASPTTEDVQRLHDELEIVSRAIDLQTQKVGDCVNEASRRLALTLRPQYEAILGKLARALREAARLADDGRDFFIRLEEAGIHSGWIPQQHVTAWLTLKDDPVAYSLNRWLSEAAEAYPGVV